MSKDLDATLDGILRLRMCSQEQRATAIVQATVALARVVGQLVERMRAEYDDAEQLVRDLADAP